MNKQQAIDSIQYIRKQGVDRSSFPDSMKGALARDNWDDPRFTLGMEYGFMLALMGAFEITETDIIIAYNYKNKTCKWTYKSYGEQSPSQLHAYMEHKDCEEIGRLSNEHFLELSRKFNYCNNCGRKMEVVVE